MVNRLYNFSKNDRWVDMLRDILADKEHDINKLDEITVTVSDKLNDGNTFEPDFDEPIRIVHKFDKKLKYVQFRGDLCANCGATETEKDRELLTKYKIVLPVCELCVQRRKDIPKRNPLKN